MSIAEDTISEDKDTGLLPDDPSVSSNDDQGYELDDSASLFTDETEVSASIEASAETPLAQDDNENSPLEELEVLYDSSAEVTTGDSESVVDEIPVLQEFEAMSDSSSEATDKNSETISNNEEPISNNVSTGDSVLEELEAMYGSSNGSTSENSETVLNVEEPISENESTGDSVLQELEALLSGDSVESVVNSITDEVETSEAAEYSSNESDNSGISALDELKAFLGETASHEDSKSDDTYVSNDDYSIASRRSILDELQNLLQSCIDELKAATEGGSGVSILSTEVDYPSHYELKNLLETKLSELAKISAASVSTDYVVDGSSVLDELSELLGETEINNSENVSDISVSLDEVDDYLSSIGSGDGASDNDETVATDSVLDELKELLGESDDMETGIPVSYSVSDYSLDDVPDETPLLDPLEDLLSASGEIEDSEMLQDSSTASVAETWDTEKGENEKSVLEEFAAYMDGSSDLPGIATVAPAEETETESAFDEVDSTSDTLEQLEAMLNESSAYIDEKSSETIPLNEDDSPIEYEAPQLSANNEEGKHEDTSGLKNKIPPAEVKTESRVQNSLQKTENNNRLPIVGMSLVAVAVIGLIVFWNSPGDQDSQESRLLLRQSKSLTKPVIVSTESEPLAQVEVKPTASILVDNADNIDGFSATIETSEYETEPLYESEANDSYENAQHDLYEVPVQYIVDEPLNNEVIDSRVEIDVLPRQQPEAGYEITENRIIELIVQQIQKVQHTNENSIALLEESTGLLNERMVEAESSISKLQFALEKHEQLKPVQPASPVTSAANIEHQIKQAQHENEENISLLSDRLIAAESSISKLQSALEKAKQLKPVLPASPVTLTINTEDQLKQVQDKNDKNFGLLNERVIEAESSISKLQHAVEKHEQLEPIQSVSSIAAKMKADHSSKQVTGNLKDQTYYTIWSVHLMSFYGKPPPASELGFLDIAGVPYKIKKTIVKGGIWYRVLVNNSSEYSAAREYAEMLKKRLGIKKIWISKSEHAYD